MKFIEFLFKVETETPKPTTTNAGNRITSVWSARRKLMISAQILCALVSAAPPRSAGEELTRSQSAALSRRRVDVDLQQGFLVVVFGKGFDARTRVRNIIHGVVTWLVSAPQRGAWFVG
jgi:hypothetical protein